MVLFEAQTRSLKERDDLRDVEFVMLFGRHPVHQLQPDEHRQDRVDTRRWNGQNSQPVGTEEARDGVGESVRPIGRDVFEYGQSTYAVEAPESVRHVGREHARQKFKCRMLDRASQARVNPDSVSEAGSESIEQGSVMAADVEDARAARNDTNGAIDTATANESVDAFHWRR